MPSPLLDISKGYLNIVIIFFFSIKSIILTQSILEDNMALMNKFLGNVEKIQENMHQKIDNIQQTLSESQFQLHR